MSAPPSTHRVLVLRVNTPGESFRRIDLLSAEAGAVLCLQRMPRTGAPRDRPDLFDSAEAVIESPRSGTGPAFLKDYRLLRRRSAIGGSYHALRDASTWCAFLVANAPHLADPDGLHALAGRTLDAFDSHPAGAGLVLLKGLYLLARGEGYPVRESWWPALDASLQPTVREILNAPVPESPDPRMVESAAAATAALLRWVAGETDLDVPAC